MPPSDFATADIDKVLNDLTTAEAIHLTAGVGFWHTYCVDRPGIPAIKVCHSHPMPMIDLLFMMAPSSLAMGRMVFEEVVT